MKYVIFIIAIYVICLSIVACISLYLGHTFICIFSLVMIGFLSIKANTEEEDK